MKLTDQQKIEIIDKYQTGLFSLDKLGREYSVYGSTIGSLLKRRNISIRNDRSEVNRKYSVDNSYFDIIDSEEKAYFLGWMYSDGNNYPPQKTISISLQEEDREILEKFQIAVKSNRPLEYVPNLNKKDGHLRKPQWKISISSENLSKRLTQLGCPQAKSLILKFPTEEQVPKNLLKHWLRGMWDGDGTFCCWESVSYGNYKNKEKSFKRFNLESSIIGTENICLGIRDFIMLETNIKTRVKNIKNKEVKRLKNTNICDIYKFMLWLYSNSTVHLKRKYEKCKEIEQALINSKRVQAVPFFTE